MCNFWWATLIQYLNFTLKHLYSFCLFQKAVQVFLVLTSLEREFLPTHMAWKAEEMLLLGATCVHKAVFLNSFLNYFWPVSCFAYLTYQSGKEKTDLHSSLLVVSAVKCIQVAKWRGIPDDWSVLMLAQNGSTCIKTKIRRVLSSCRWHGSSCIQSHTLRSWAGRACASGPLQHSEHCCPSAETAAGPEHLVIAPV